VIHRIELSPKSEPSAIRSVDFGPGDRTLLVGRHSREADNRLATLTIVSESWQTSYDRALSGAATRARYCDGYRQIVFVDERAAAWLVDSAGGGVQPYHLGDGVRHVATTASSTLVALSGQRVWIVDVAGQPRDATDEAVRSYERAIAGMASRDALLAIMAEGAEALTILDRQGNTVRAIATSLQGADSIVMSETWVAVIGSGMRGCGVWRVADGAAAGQIFCNPDQNNNTAQALHPSRPLAAYGTIAGYLVLVDLEANEIRYMEGLHRTRIWDVAFSASGMQLATAGDDGAISVIDIEEVETLGTSRVPV
jgi:hypothetical protein